jgi:hypothetical protein
LPDKAWTYLFEIYEGIDLPRYSIELAVENNDNDGSSDVPTKRQFMIEVYLKKMQIYILPKLSNHLCLKKPAAIYISRRAKVINFRMKIAEILR